MTSGGFTPITASVTEPRASMPPCGRGAGPSAGGVSNASCTATAFAPGVPEPSRPAPPTATTFCRSAPNLLDRNFAPAAPNQVWLTDITYVPTDEGWLYVAVVLDLFSRKAIGWAMRDHLRTELPLAALTMALQRQRPAPGLLHHSDRGCQYASAEYRIALESYGITQSMSRKGNCWDNAPMESFFGTLKSELVHHRRYATREDAKRDLFAYIEGYYNRQRLHSAIGYRTPEQAELQAA